MHGYGGIRGIGRCNSKCAHVGNPSAHRRAPFGLRCEHARFALSTVCQYDGRSPKTGIAAAAAESSSKKEAVL